MINPDHQLLICITANNSRKVGLILYGCELDNRHSGWVAPLAGMALFVFGQEIIVTVILTYMCDCYPDQAAEVAIVFQFFFNLMCFHPPFYTPQWIAQPAGAKVPYIVYAVLPVVFFPFCVGLLMWKGREIRNKGPLFSFKKNA